MKTDYKGYVYIEIPKGEDILYPFIDFIHESWGIENIGIREHEQLIYIAMKAGESILQNPLPFTLRQLFPFIKEGTIEIVECYIHCSKCLSQNKFRVADQDVG